MFKNSRRIFVTISGWDKKKLEKYNLTKTDGIGFAHITALIRFFYHKDPEKMSLDERCKLESELVWIAKMGLIPMAQLPLQLQ